MYIYIFNNSLVSSIQLLIIVVKIHNNSLSIHIDSFNDS